VPLICGNCGAPLLGGDEAAMFLCTACGLVYEPGEAGLASFSPLTASATTELAVAGAVQYLAIWRLTVAVKASASSAWERISRVVAPQSPYLYVPAFSLMRQVMQRLGTRMTQVQPALDLTPGTAEQPARRPALVEVRATGRSGAPGGAVGGPDFGKFSPVVVGRKDAHVLAHFVFLAVESHECRDLSSVDYDLETESEELILVPAVWDPRFIHEANWRLLLSEFDGLVA
jgi:hypothetical protein